MNDEGRSAWLRCPADGSSFTLLDASNSGLQTSAINAVTVDLNNNVWVGTTSGLYAYNSSRTLFASPSISSPVDKFSVSKDGPNAAATFVPNTILNGSAKFELQRGRSTAKFWTVSSTDFTSVCCSPIQLKDTMPTIGNFCYRIKCVESTGITSYSQVVSFAGGQAQASLLDSQWDLTGYRITFRWKTDNEAYISRFEILRYDSISDQLVTVGVLSAASPKDITGYYVMETDSLTSNSTKCLYSLVAVFADSTVSVLKTFVITPPIFPSTFTVSENFPNPFNGYTSLELYLPTADRITINIFDALGKKLSTQLIENFSQGYQRVEFNLGSLSSGVYFYRVQSSDKRVVGKMIMVK